MKAINKIMTAILAIAVLSGGNMYAFGADNKTLKDYQERTKKDIENINKTSDGYLGLGDYALTSAITAGSVGALWAIHARLLKRAADKKMQLGESYLRKALQARDAALKMADTRNAKLNAVESSRRLAEKAKQNVEGELLQERAALNIVKERLSKAYETNLLHGAAYIYAYKTQNPALVKYLDIDGPGRIYANIESFELADNIKILGSDKSSAAYVRELKALLESLPKDAADIPSEYYIKKAELYKRLRLSPKAPQLKFWIEESIVKEDLPFVLAASKDMAKFLESVRDYEAKGETAVARQVIEKAVREEPALARVLPKTFKRFGVVATLFTGAFLVSSATMANPRVDRLRANPALFLKADADTLARVQKDRELTDALIMMSNTIHEISLMPKAEMKRFLSMVTSDQQLKKRQINLSVPTKKQINFAKYGSL